MKNNSKFTELNNLDLNGFTCFLKDRLNKKYHFEKLNTQTKMYEYIKVKFKNFESIETMLKLGYSDK